MDEMEWRVGQRLRHLKLQDLGVGEVTGVEGDKLRVRFGSGERVFMTTAAIEQVAAPPAPSQRNASLSASPKTAGKHSTLSAEEARRRFQDQDVPFELEAPRGQRVDVWGPCSQCDNARRPLWYYARSSRGAVYLCVPCKDRLREGSRDVLDLSPRRVLRSAFETKR
jgi:hypothetical protein